jgi:hypothetical protein
VKRTSPYLCLMIAFLLAAFAACSGSQEPVDDPNPFPDPTGECDKSEDCPEATPICDELAGCVECQFDKDCEENQRCHRRECVPKVACTSSLECTTEQPICDQGRSICVVCLADPDCGPDARCVNETCEEVKTCVNSRDCDEGTVCDLARSFCVDCVGDLDCGEEQVCVDRTCQDKCGSDKECVSEGLLCDRAAAHCVECLRDADCPETYYCAGGKCQEDICSSGDATCRGLSLSAPEVSTCNENGSGYVLSGCPFETTCQKDSDRVVCKPWVCSPGGSECTDTSTLSACAADGLSATEIDCSKMGGACEPGPRQCVDVVCTPNGYSCENGVSMVCNARGTALSLAETCSENQYCAEKTGKCELDVCAPGSLVCDGNVVNLCAADGSGYSKQETCTEGESVCSGGACLPIVCDAKKNRHCYDGNVYGCGGGGSERVLTTSCTARQQCQESGNSASCVDITCEANEKTCIGVLAGTCNETGTGLEGTATDCSDTDQACFEGECKDVVCTGRRVCDELNNIRDCGNNGTTLGFIWDYCSENEYCQDQASGYAECLPDACTTGQLSCEGGDITRCRPDGSGYDPFEECPLDQTCVQGTCLPVICDAGAYYCLNGNPYLCGADGTTNQLTDTCTLGEYCRAQNGFASCAADVCTAGSSVCNGANVSTCAADGSGPSDAGATCPSGQVCAGGACADVLCEPASYRCFNDARQTCNATGTAWGSAVTCSSAQFCDESPLPSAPVCATDLCVAGQPTCDGETLATCGPYGGSFTAQGTDCSLTGQVCNKSACVDVEKLTLAESAPLLSTSLTLSYFNRFFVRTPRKLTEIEQYFTTSGTSQFTFYVYRSASPTYYSFERVLEKLVTASPSSSYVSSGAIEVTLEAGNYYAIGVRTSGTHSYSALSSPDTFASFARVEGGYQTTSTPGPTLWIGKSTTTHRQRLSLAPVP